MKSKFKILKKIEVKKGDFYYKIKHKECGKILIVKEKEFNKDFKCEICNRNQKKGINYIQYRKEFDLNFKDFELLSEYRKSQKPIQVKCKKCSYEKIISPLAFKRNTMCNECNYDIIHKKNSGTKKSDEDFKKQVFELANGEYVFLDKYVNAKTPIRYRHNVCGREDKMSPDCFINKGQRCKCRSKIALGKNRTTEEFIKIIKDKYGDEYEVLGKYINAKTLIKIKHKKCNNMLEMIPDNLIRGFGCKICANNQKKTHEEILREINYMYGDEYEILEEYKNMDTPILIKHKICGESYKKRPSLLLNNVGCSFCSGNAKKTIEQIKQEAFELYGDEYEIVSTEYINIDSPIEILHKKCGKVSSKSAYSFLKGASCKYCYCSKGEERVKEVLNKNNVSFTFNEHIEGVKDIRHLRFDFKIYDCNICNDSDIKLIVEYDGIGHFEPIDAFGGINAFRDVQRRDKIKNKYCRENNIPILRIPYWEFNNIEEILLKELKQFNII